MAAYTWVGTTSNWSTGSNWSPAAPAGGPTSADTVTINNAAPCTVTAASSCLTINFTGYTSTFTINSGFTLTVFGTAITLATGMTYDQTTTGILSTRGNQTAITITFAGITIPNLTLGKTTAGSIQTVTISGTTPIIKNLVITNGFSSAVVTLTGPAITITGSLSNTLGPLTNNTGQITFSGACTISSFDSSASISGGFIVGSGSSLQMTSNVYLQNGTVTFSGGTLNPNTFTLFCPGIVTFNTSTVTWYNVTLSASGQVYPLLSALNISNNLTITSSTTGLAFSGGFTINLSGSLLTTNSNQLGLGTSILNMLGTGLIDIAGITNGTLNINGTGTYTIGSATNPTLTATSLTINLVGTSIAQVYSTTSHTLSTQGGLTLSTNNTPTGANIVGGSQITWGNISLTSNQTTTLTYDTIALGNLSSVSHALNGAKLYVAGNLSVTTVISGTATIELNGSTNTTWSAGSYQNNIIVNKTGVGTKVTTAAGTITWGLANRTLTMNSAVDFLAGSTTFTLSGTPLTINDTFGNPFFNVNIPASTLNITGILMRINSNLTLTAAGATFAGTFGWDCNNLICTTAGTFNITLQQLITYRTRTGVSITGGTSGLRPTMTSSGASNAIWTLDFGATQSLIYVNGTRIDSSGGQTVWSFGVSPANIATTINWNPGVPLRTVAYTFVN